MSHRIGTVVGRGYRGKLEQRERARALRSSGWTMPDIAAELGVSRSSVSSWTRDVPVAMGPRRVATPRANRLRDARMAEIAAMDAWGRARLGATLSEQAFLAAGAALYAGEGAKGDREVAFANSDPAMVAFFCAWLRTFFDVDESRLRVAVYLHQGLDLDAAQRTRSACTGVPLAQFTKAYRAVADPSIRHNKHEFGCARVRYSCASTHRAVMGLCRALLTSPLPFRGSSIGRAFDC